MPKIKFSHNYVKLNGIAKNVELLEVINVNLENLSETFLSYDTDNIYKLPKQGKYLMLIFRKTFMLGNLFTTLRRRTPQKEKYYRSQIGAFFEVVIFEKSN